MPLGRKVADIYAELSLDKDQLRAAMAAAGGEMGADADRLGKSLGDRMSQGMAGQVEELSARLAKARLAEQKATDAVALSQARLTEAEGKGNVEGSRLLALQQKLSQAESALAIAHDNTSKATLRHADAERRLAADLEKLGKDVGPAADRAGQDTGDKLSQGIHLAVIRNSPMIAAAVGGGLAAGAPVVLAAAGALFGGIAAYAVHSNAQVQSAFAGTKDVITSTFTDAAQVTVPMFVGALGRIGSAVQAMGPQLHGAFASLGGPIDSLTTGLIQMTQNALPGLVSAVRSAGPVFDGLASLMSSVGTGLGQFFQIISEHSQAAGTVFSSLGSIIGSLLPILGQLVGVGAELASQILPPIASVLHVVESALNAVAPILPTVAAGFGAFMVVKSLSGPMETFAGKLSNMGSVGAAAGGALSKVAGAMPAIGAAAGVLGGLFQASSQQIDSWGHALLAGGTAAEQASTQMRQINSAMTEGASGFALSISGGRDLANAFGVGTNAMKSAQQAAKDLFNSMSPLEQAQQRVTTAQNELEAVLADPNHTADQAVTASSELKSKQDALTQAQNQLTQATEGVSKAVTDAANAVIAATDSSFAYRDAQFQVKDAETNLAQAIRAHGGASDQAARAGLGLEEALNKQAEAAGRLASDSLPATATALQKSQAASAGTLAELIKLRDQMGSAFPASLQTTIDQLQATGVNLDQVGAKHPTPTVSLDQGPFASVFSTVQSMIGNLDGQHPTPTAGINAAPFNFTLGGLQGALNGLNGWRVYPWATLLANTSGAEGALNYAARNRTSYVTQLITTKIGSGSYGAATGGKIGNVVGAFGQRFDVGGKIRGPGGPTDDLVQAVTDTGAPLRVSNDEWVIPGAPSKRYGDTKMAAIVAGKALVSLPSAGRGSSQPSPGVSGGGSPITVQSMTLSFPNVLSIGDASLPRQLVSAMRDGIRKLEASER